LFEVGIFAQGQAECRTVVVFGQSGLEIGRRDMVWASLVPAPLHEEAKGKQICSALTAAVIRRSPDGLC
jgi:hypothetical protein